MERIVMPPPRPSPAGFVYLVRCHDFVKIGIATDVKARLSCLQTGSPYILKLLAYRKSFNAAAEEAALHEQFKAYHINGEWFRIPKTMLKTLADSLKSLH